MKAQGAAPPLLASALALFPAIESVYPLNSTPDEPRRRLDAVGKWKKVLPPSRIEPKFLKN
jgi:hypothetical protein